MPMSRSLAAIVLASHMGGCGHCAAFVVRAVAVAMEASKGLPRSGATPKTASAEGDARPAPPQIDSTAYVKWEPEPVREISGSI